jgi:AcrR family transcriptional regulator
MTLLRDQDGQAEINFTPRQTVVLEHALRLLADGGEKALTTGRLAHAASCSKESLYKWFGNRAGIVASMIAYQSTKVRTFSLGGRRLTARGLSDELLIFANDLLEVLEGPTSLAVNRLAIAQSADGNPRFGAMLLEKGRSQVENRAKTLLNAGRRSGLLSFDAADEAYHVFYGLVVSDRHIQALIGKASTHDRKKVARLAVRLFLSLYGSDTLLRSLFREPKEASKVKTVGSRREGYRQ